MNSIIKVKAVSFIRIFTLLICICNAQAEDITQSLKVSVDGKDSSARCKKNELPNCLDGLTLERAFEWISGSEIKRIGKGGIANVNMYLSPGVYRLATPLAIIRGATTDYHGKLTIIGPNAGNALISGAQVVNEFSLVNHPLLNRVPDEAKKHVLTASVKSVKKGSWRSPAEGGFGRSPVPVTVEVFFRGEPMQVAGWPDKDFSRIIASSAKPIKGDKRFGIEGHDITGLSDEPDLVARGYFSRDWAEESIPVEKIDIGSKELVLTGPGTKFGIKGGMRIRLENALSELDHPGEWYLDRSTDMLYFWPPRPIKTGDVEVSIFDTLLRIDGAKNVRIANLQFEKSRGNAITIKDSENVLLEKSLIRYAGNKGVIISGGKNSGLREVTIENMGEGGVVLQGGERNTLSPANLFVDSCKITRFNRLSSTYRPAVLMEGVGNRVVHSTISNGPHNAIMFNGNNHLIAFNNISNVVQDTDDAGAIYTGRDWTARGTVIEGNFFHDIGSPGSKKSLITGVYLDDQSSGIVVRGNIFARVQSPVFIGGGRDNIVEHNLFFHSAPAIHLDARGVTWQRKQTIDPIWDLQKRLNAVPYKKSLYSKRYPNLSNILDDDIGLPKYNVFRQNIIIDSGLFQIAKEAKKGILIEENFHKSDDIFIKSLPPDHRIHPVDFYLKEPSQLLRSGFELPELERMAK